jgi:hypothetical protein
MKSEFDMFNLDQAIAQWRNELRAAGMNTPALLDELESHLRDEVERQRMSEGDARHAFENAVRQIGQPAALKSEFGKLGETGSARSQKFMRVYCVVFPVINSTLGTYALQRAEMSSGERALGFLALGLSALFILGIPFYDRFLPVISNQRRRQSIQLGLVVAWMVLGGGFVNFILPHLNLTLGQVVVTFLWVLMPGALLSGIGYGLGVAARRQTATTAV